MGKSSSLKPHRATERATDKQIGGKHYQSYSIQPIEFIVANKLDFIQGNIIKYALRFQHKGGVEDLKKLQHYVAFLVKQLETKDGSESND